LNTTTIAVTEPKIEKRRASSKTALLGILLLYAIIYLGSAFTPGLQDDVDSTHAEAAREMITRGDYVTLHVNGVRYLEKAPMLYWLIAGSFHVFGVNAFATRVPTLLSVLGLILLAMHWGRRSFGELGSTYGGLFVVTGMGYFLFTRVLFPEAILSLFIAVAFYSFLTALELNQSWRWYLGYAALALAVLTKGALPLVIIGIPAVAFIVITGDWRRWREFHLPTGLLLFVAIAAPWHILAGIRNDRFFWFYFINEHVLRFLGRRYPKDYNKLPAFLYWSLHLVWLFPWSLFLPVAVRRWIRDYRTSRTLPQIRKTFRYRSQLLWLLWASVTLVFFAFSTNQEYYTFPAYLPLLLLLAGALAEEEEEPGRNRWLVATTAVTAVIALAASFTLFAALWSSRHLPFVPDIGDVLAKPDLSSDTLSMGHMLDLTGQSFAALRLPAMIAAITLLVGPPLAFFLRRRARNFASTWATAATLALFLVAAHVALVRFDPYLGSSTIAADLAPQIKPQDHLMIYGDQAYGSSLLFYLKRPIELVNGATTSMWFGSTYADAPPIFLKDADLLRLWKSNERVFLFVPRYQRNKVDSLLDGNSKYVVSDRSGKIVYSNRL
jgi:4-amino-4-deoxy-L-arabinose transferase-like glycosyltransferase